LILRVPSQVRASLISLNILGLYQEKYLMEKIDVLKAAFFIVVILFAFTLFFGIDISKMFEFSRTFLEVSQNTGSSLGAGVR
jgi:hypothetical protein